MEFGAILEMYLYDGRIQRSKNTGRIFTILV